MLLWETGLEEGRQGGRFGGYCLAQEQSSDGRAEGKFSRWW